MIRPRVLRLICVPGKVVLLLTSRPGEAAAQAAVAPRPPVPQWRAALSVELALSPELDAGELVKGIEIDHQSSGRVGVGLVMNRLSPRLWDSRQEGGQNGQYLTQATVLGPRVSLSLGPFVRIAAGPLVAFTDVRHGHYNSDPASSTSVITRPRLRRPEAAG